MWSLPHTRILHSMPSIFNVQVPLFSSYSHYTSTTCCMVIAIFIQRLSRWSQSNTEAQTSHLIICILCTVCLSWFWTWTFFLLPGSSHNFNIMNRPTLPTLVSVLPEFLTLRCPLSSERVLPSATLCPFAACQLSCSESLLEARWQKRLWPFIQPNHGLLASDCALISQPWRCSREERSMTGFVASRAQCIYRRFLLIFLHK